MTNIASFFNWNVRGLNNQARRKVVRDHVQESGCTIVYLQETKMEQIDERVVAESLGNRFKDQFIVLPSVGASGGALLELNKDYYTLKYQKIGDHTQ